MCLLHNVLHLSQTLIVSSCHYHQHASMFVDLLVFQDITLLLLVRWQKNWFTYYAKLIFAWFKNHEGWKINHVNYACNFFKTIRKKTFFTYFYLQLKYKIRNIFNTSRHFGPRYQILFIYIPEFLIFSGKCRQRSETEIAFLLLISKPNKHSTFLGFIKLLVTTEIFLATKNKWWFPLNYLALK